MLLFELAILYKKYTYIIGGHCCSTFKLAVEVVTESVYEG